MPPETLRERYTRCDTDGSFVSLAEPTAEQISTMLKLSADDLQAARDWVKQSPKGGPHWNALFKIHYDILHQLTEAFVLFDKKKVRTHECLFAYLCEKHSELDFSWQFFEEIRRKRNRSIYYGEPATYADWKSIELQLNLYINTLKKSIEEKLKK
jgi:hypothetical protein